MSPDKTHKVWLVATLKGGTRKSTTTMMTAFALARRGHDALVVDADAGTQGVTDWASRVYAAGGELPFDVAQWTHALGLLVPFVQTKQRETGARFVLIDVGGEAPEVLRQAVVIADRVISPTGAEQAELSRLAPTSALVREADAPMSVLLNRVPSPGAGVARAVREALTRDGFDVLRTEIPQNRERYAHVWGTVPDGLEAYDELAAELLELEKVGKR
jgi:cellulose biosynthesis protein BcsQ